MTSTPLTRRQTLIGSCLGLAGVLPAPFRRRLPIRRAPEAGGVVRFGVITDVHQDVMHDAAQRVSAFAAEMERRGVDFVIELGDFCQPRPANDGFRDAWRSFPGPRHHVIGNHDMDGGFSREQVVAYLGMPARHYAFDVKGLHCIVLDGNDPGGTSGGYARLVGAEQLAWLEAQLAANPRPTVVFIHQPLDSSDGIDNRDEVRALLAAAGRRPGHPGVVAVIAGHSHVDYTRLLDGTYHLLVNSASYVWVGGDHRHESYPREIHEQHPWIDHTCPFRDPLWAVVSIDLARGVMEVEGRSTTWVGPDPIACGADPETGFWGWAPEFSAPRVSSWRAPLRERGDVDARGRR